MPPAPRGTDCSSGKNKKSKPERDSHPEGCSLAFFFFLLYFFPPLLKFLFPAWFCSLMGRMVWIFI